MSFGQRRPVARRNVLLAGLIGFRAVLPLVVLAGAGSSVLWLPSYTYDPVAGDAYGYYSAMRAILNEWQTHATVLVPVSVAASAGLGLLWFTTRTMPSRIPARIGLASWALGLVGGLLAWFVPYSGAPTVGWPLIWSVPLLPYRALGLPLNPDIAFAVGLPLCIAATAVTTWLTYVIGQKATGSRIVGLVAAAAYSVWPLAVLVIGGHRGTLNGTWFGLVGLTLYTEPISTALVAAAIALLLRDATSARAAAAGALLGLSATLRLSNALIILSFAALLALWRWWVLAGWFTVCAAAFAPIVAAFWSKGYVSLPARVFPAHPFALRYARRAWTDSFLWHPSVLAWLIPLAALGVFTVGRRVGAVFGLVVATTALFYTFYEPTPRHPRFLFVVLPIVFALWAAGGARVASLTRRAFCHQTTGGTGPAAINS